MLCQFLGIMMFQYLQGFLLHQKEFIQRKCLFVWKTVQNIRNKSLCSFYSRECHAFTRSLKRRHWTPVNWIEVDIQTGLWHDHCSCVYIGLFFKKGALGKCWMSFHWPDFFGRFCSICQPFKWAYLQLSERRDIPTQHQNLPRGIFKSKIRSNLSVLDPRVEAGWKTLNG